MNAPDHDQPTAALPSVVRVAALLVAAVLVATGVLFAAVTFTTPAAPSATDPGAAPPTSAPPPPASPAPGGHPAPGNDGDQWALFDGDPVTGTLAEIETWCKTGGVERRDCVYEYFLEQAAASVPDAMALIEQLKVTDRRFIADCHHAYHGVGQTATATIGVDAGLQIATPACQAGYIHGVLQGWTVEATAAEIAAGYRSRCDVLTQTRGQQLLGFCGHGVGHALALHFPDDIVAVADMCASIPEGRVADGCMEGTIMEFGGLDHVTEHLKDTLGKRPSDSLTAEQRRNLCSLVPERVGEICAHRVFQLWSGMWDDTTEFGGRCAEMRTPAMVAACASSFGDTLLWRPEPPVLLTDPVERIAEGVAPCTELPGDQPEACVTGFVETIWRDEPLGSTVVDTVCPAIPANLRDACETAERNALQIRAAA